MKPWMRCAEHVGSRRYSLKGFAAWHRRATWSKECEAAFKEDAHNTPNFGIILNLNVYTVDCDTSVNGVRCGVDGVRCGVDGGKVWCGWG